MNKHFGTMVFLSPLLALLGSSASAQTWDLAADYNPPANPNGPWSYGQINGGVFSTLPWTPLSGYPNLNGIYGTSGAFVYQNIAAYPAYGINPGQISLESDYGNTAVQWTAPATGEYEITAAIGGTTVSENGGFGNNFAQFAGLNINGVSQPDNSFADNVMSWDITDLSLTDGETVDAFVLNPGYAFGGNTETELTINEVPTTTPEPSALLGGAAILVILASGTRARKCRSSHKTA